MTDQHCLSQVIQDRYRCPEDTLGFQLAGDLSQGSGFFRFGEDAICYGRTVSGDLSATPKGQLRDVLYDIETLCGKLVNAIDTGEGTGNLRLERYPHDARQERENLLKKFYYFLRPLTTTGIRRAIKRVHAGNWKHIPIPHWPVDTTVETVT